MNICALVIIGLHSYSVLFYIRIDIRKDSSIIIYIDCFFMSQNAGAWRLQMWEWWVPPMHTWLNVFGVPLGG